jgi:predicted negative regulator of RcsB-dependent stress response
MKAERRHDLKTNALARGVEGAPDLWREYGSRILLMVLVAAIVFLLVRYWNDKKARDAATLVESMETATSSVRQLGVLPLEVQAGGSASDIAENRQKITQQAEQAINVVLNSSKDPKQLANAYLARGDLNWTLANFPTVPGAETLPSTLQLSNRETFVEQARTSYAKILEPAYSGSTADVFYARMGLAAIAENAGQWDQAKAQYQAISGGKDMPESFKDIANARLTMLPKYQSPALLVAPPVAVAPPPVSTEPTSTAPTTGLSLLSTLPAVMIPATVPVTMPSTAPSSGPTTRP